MSTITPSGRSSGWTGTALILIVLVIALWFIATNAVRYLGFDPEAYGRFWEFKVWLFGHVAGGMLALIIGPFQFIPAIRNRNFKRHRLLGKIYLISIVIGATCSIYLSFNSAMRIHWTWSIALLSLGLPWLVSAGMAYRAIRLRRIGQHRDWMIRSYVITFGFVMFRILNDELFSHVGNFVERGPTLGWLAWAIPLFFAEVCIQWNKKD
ncbi:MAG: DUF2306 domain-containing protein [Saprospiraceae bacterium]|nr:DUF2306 domain-containing protein [Saprospiraceae bacterium]